MFSLIKYHNDTYSVVPSNKVEKRDRRDCVVKSNGGKYSAFFISKNDNKSVLLDLKKKREENCVYQSLPAKLPSPKKSIVIWIDRSPSPLRELENENKIPNKSSLSNETIDKHNSTEQSSIQMQSSIQIKKENNLVLPYSSIYISSEKSSTLIRFPQKEVITDNDNIDKHNRTEQMQKENNDIVLPKKTTNISSPQKEDITEISSTNLDSSTSEYLPNSTTENYEISNDQNGSISTTASKSINVIRNTLNISSVIVPHRSNKYKKHFCLFCKTLQTKLARHFFLKHKSEKEIKSALSYPKKSKERLSIIEELRKNGDFMHNTSTEHNSGILIVSRQQQKKTKNEANDYTCCKNCKGFFSKKTLRLHLQKCGKNKPNSRENIIVGRRLTQYVHSAANDVVKTRIFPVLTDDKVTKSIQYDELIIKYANELSEKYISVHHHDMIRAQLRLLGRFKIEAMKQNSEIKQFKDIFKPQLFDSCMEAFRIVANWDNNLMWFKTPAVAQSLATLIKKCGYQQLTEIIKSQEMDSKKDVEDFLLLWKEEIPSLLNKRSSPSRKRRRTSPFGKTKRVRWSEEERNAVHMVFGDLKELDGLPKLSECHKAIRRCPELKNRTPEQLKTFIDNQRRYK